VTSGSGPCPFCALDDACVVYQHDLVFAFRDRFPVSDGHTLVVPRRHVETYFDLGAMEQAELWHAVEVVKLELDRELQPDGYNVGFNAGTAAGQTVMHAHVHVIPRFAGDVPDPRGGVRGVIPGKQRY
jgi:diadenosine tetraphosphate (Ap4A) HIT family hydrolase